jgi:DNA-binding NtrC family response regulator
MESEIIRMAISRYDGHMSEVARRLGIGRSTLYRKLKEFGLEESAGISESAIETETGIEESLRKAG